MTNTSNFSVGVDFDRVLDTIASHIYDNQYAFLRENVQNAIDAVRIQADRDKRPVQSGYRIDIIVEGNRCEIHDTGNGMTKDQLRTNFWTMGASGKHTDEAKRAGCIGTFGIGGFANFGVCDQLTVISRTTKCQVTHETMLKKSDFDTIRGHLPTVAYKETHQLTDSGTIVIGEAELDFDAEQLLKYIKQFVSDVRENIYFNKERISGSARRTIGDNYTAISEVLDCQVNALRFRYRLYRDDGAGLAAELISASEYETGFDFSGFVRLENGSLRAYKRGFKICDISINSRIGISGWFDSDIVRPTAGRDTLNAESLARITQMFRLIEQEARARVVLDEELLAAHIRLLPEILATGDLSLLHLLRVRTLDGNAYLLSEIATKSKQTRIFYSVNSKATPAAEVLQAKGDLIVSVTNDRSRRKAEISYLQERCDAKRFDDLIERLEPYSDLDEFERALLAELDMAIKRLFKPEEFRFLPGRLTLDVPIYWSNKKEGSETIVYVDTRHGEFKKLRPLGYTPLLWSMIEAFCREYLGDTLRKRSTKFFGDGAIDLESYAKSQAELWELVPSEIETSLLSSGDASARRRRRFGARVEIVRVRDITQLQVASHGGAETDAGTSDFEDVDADPPGKLLEIIDSAGSTGLGGFYLRIPVPASKAFGEIIRTFSSFAVVWFANCITWSGTDNKDTAFLYHVTLEELIGSVSDPHGAIDLTSSQLQYFKGQVYFFIPTHFHQYLVPRDQDRGIKVSVTHQLVDLGKSRAWTSRDF